MNGVPPSLFEVDVGIRPTIGGYGMDVEMALEFTNPFPDEGMVVWIKQALQFVNDAKEGELVCVDSVIGAHYHKPPPPHRAQLLFLSVATSQF